MGYVVRMPQLGMSMEEGTVVEWSATEGETVGDGAGIAVVESEKTAAEIEAREDGVLRRILVDEGGTVAPGDPIGVVAGPDEELQQYLADLDVPDAAAAAAGAGAGSGSTTDEASGGASSASGSDADVRATPGARALATEEGAVDLTAVEGTGPQGVVTEDDVRAALDADAGPGDAPAPDGAADEDVRATPGARRRAEEAGVSLAGIDGTGPQGVVTEDDVEESLDADTGRATRTVADARGLSGMQRTVSERLAESDRNAVHVTLNRSFDATALSTTVEAAREVGADLSVTDLLLKAVARALGDHPELNAVFEDGEHRLIEEVNIGVAVDVDEGLVTPVVADVAQSSAASVGERRRELTDRVERGDFTTDDLRGGTFTVSNLGHFGVDHFDPIIDPPQVAILGVGRIREDGSTTLSLSFDHRVINGADAARFLDTLVGTATDEAALASFCEVDVGARDAARGAETRAIRVGTASGLSGSYAVDGVDGEVAFDEPMDAGGPGLAPTPVEHLLGALGSCLSLALREMADRDDVEIGGIDTDVDGRPTRGPLEAVEVDLRIESDAGTDALDRAVTKAERACYVERALSDDVDVSVTWARAG